MNFSFENQGTNTYLVYSILDEDNIDSMSLGMITNNKIVGLAQTIFTQMDTMKYIKYNISAKISAKQLFSGAVNKARLIGVFSSIVDALLSAEDYMIDTNTILLDLDYIFTDVSTCEALLICLPINNNELANNDLGSFFKNIMFTTQFDQTENCDHVAKIINFLNSSPVFSLVDFKKILDEIKNSPVNNMKFKEQVSDEIKSTPIQRQIVKSESHVIKQPEIKPQTVIPTKKQQFVQPEISKEKPPIEEKSDEKKISLMTLLMHYNKENAALYKSQRATKKAQGDSNSNQNTKTSNTSFTVPGAPTNTNFAIPGQAQDISTVAAKATQKTSMPSKNEAESSHITNSSEYVPTKQAIIQEKAANFGETTVLNVSKVAGETTVLNAVQVTSNIVKPYLIRIKNNEKILLDKPVFRIGKEYSYVDYFISDNTAISRSHANIILRENQYFVVDTNSTNHTYLNGIMIQSSVETEIKDGDKIRFANEDFEFSFF